MNRSSVLALGVAGLSGEVSEVLMAVIERRPAFRG